LEITSEKFSWKTLASTVAAHKASYFAEKEGMSVYKEEYHACLNHDEEIMDWYLGNMDPADLEWIKSAGAPDLETLEDMDLEIDIITI
ncbi:hypothetical protein, partial [Propionibacterium freudenreichii]|uniref:hypothetical protein n=1 Tax=Propionibacterium freudenreichii TaxID=1744 RepID=UPI003854D7A4